jgi:hypothetical protein
MSCSTRQDDKKAATRFPSRHPARREEFDNDKKEMLRYSQNYEQGGINV